MHFINGIIAEIPIVSTTETKIEKTTNQSKWRLVSLSNNWRSF
jgi:hypothetical protein